MISFSLEAIDPKQVYELIGKDAAGSVLLHFAVAKPMGGTHGITSHITYERNGDVEENLENIEQELRDRWDLTDVLLLRRQGRVAVGEIISLVAASSPNSEDAFAACRHGIACLKKMPTIKKTEVFS